ncbi:MAG TPA: 16S rRNA (cytidine(1402)-2'-O)-methyltransferase [Desulfotomaculum sp.]|nr:MAG: Ribosomal RNA small subunit methyltransferase I [Desulfotomaculum sp. 46_80]HAG10884.1 16S rRNA (cytidine(1402)-2'-O)-methyltransferase [Desulfotomaculum sp.]HBY04813.1 16S rRNA (cytidine(1402)-2'-O)-methyltransferase [Desulfotomaculum sp.]
MEPKGDPAAEKKSGGANGTLYLCATPIGNLEDITLRALRLLKEADLIAAEDTRHTRKLLAHYGIHTPVTSFHGHSGPKKCEYLLGLLLSGKHLILVSDAGMPGISDPGEVLVDAAIKSGVRVVPVPGPNAALAALVVSGLSASNFCFEGFLPANKRTRKKRITSLIKEERTIILYEAPHRLLKTLDELLEQLGDKRLAVARELTKHYEEVWRGSLSSALDYFRRNSPLGEFTIVLEGNKNEVREEVKTDLSTIASQVNGLQAGGMPRPAAIREVAKRNNMARNEVYAASLVRKKDEEQ